MIKNRRRRTRSATFQRSSKKKSLKPGLRIVNRETLRRLSFKMISALMIIKRLLAPKKSYLSMILSIMRS